MSIRVVPGILAAVFTIAGCSSESPSPVPPSSAPTTTPPTSAGSVSTISPVTDSAEPLRPDSLRGKVVVLDPGHNGGNSRFGEQIAQRVFIGNGFKECDTTGTETGTGYTEAEYNFDVARRVEALLAPTGAEIVLTREDNDGIGPCIDRRAMVANERNADVAVSIHADGHIGSGRGFHVIEPGPVPGLNESIVEPSARLGDLLRTSFGVATWMPRADYIGVDGIDRRTDLGGLNLTTVPKVFIETGNMKDPTDAMLLMNGEYRQQVALGIATAIGQFLSGPQ